MQITYQVQERDGRIVAMATGMSFDRALDRVKFWLEQGKNVKAWPAGLFPKDDYRARLDKIADIIDRVDQRCMAVDGPVTPTLQEMTQKELTEIWKLATFK